jgi:endonuclease/exonuclease/phosphatase family metal-dependent hydrolase
MAEYCSNLTKPVILGGDFNLLHGSSELQYLSHITDLQDVDPHKQPTFPSRMPKLKLDYLLAGQAIDIEKMEIPRIHLSDHLPLVCDFNVGGEK